MKIFNVYSKRVATELVKNGFKCIGTSINIKHTHLLVFQFNDTDQLRIAFDKIMTQGE